MVRGIDVSYAQGTISWDRVKAAGVQFAIIRATWGASGRDSQFPRNAAECERVGIPYGFYHYSYALSVAEAEKEADNFLAAIGPYAPEYPVIFDLEDSSQAGLSNQALTNIAAAFLAKVEKAGYYAMLYSMKNWLENKLILSQLSRYDVWVAQWAAGNTYKGSYGMWQYSSTGRVDGISGDVDLNYAYKDYPAAIAANSLNNHRAAPAPQPEATDSGEMEALQERLARETKRADAAEAKLTEVEAGNRALKTKYDSLLASVKMLAAKYD